MPAITALQQGPFGVAALASQRPPKPGAKDDARIAASTATTGDRHSLNRREQRPATHKEMLAEQSSSATVSPSTLFEASLIAARLDDGELVSSPPPIPTGEIPRSPTPPLQLRDRSA